MSQIEQTIDDMQAYIDDCKSPTFGGGGKVICEKDVLENFLEDLRSETPEIPASCCTEGQHHCQC